MSHRDLDTNNPSNNSESLNRVGENVVTCCSAKMIEMRARETDNGQTRTKILIVSTATMS